MLNSLRISGFRTFENLTVPSLGRVNLVVGKNNVGKTTLLEAVHLLNSGSHVPGAARRILDRRQEYGGDDVDGRWVDWTTLFHRGDVTALEVKVGAHDEEPRLLMRCQWRFRERDEEGNFRYRLVNELGDSDAAADGDRVLSVMNGDSKRSVPLNPSGAFHRRQLQVEAEDLGSVFLPFAGFVTSDIDAPDLWDRIVLTSGEKIVLSALKVIEPGLEQLAMVGGRRSDGRRSERRPIARLRGSLPSSLKSMGDGMNRLFELAVGIVNVEPGGTFLVDELDSGLHYTALQDVWRLIFEVAALRDVQVFATTHSWDCIEAFQVAASDHPEEGVLVKLLNVEGTMLAESFTETELAVITRQSIEVR